MFELPVNPPHLQVVEQNFFVVVGGGKHRSCVIKFAGHNFIFCSLDLNRFLLANIPKSQTFVWTHASEHVFASRINLVNWSCMRFEFLALLKVPAIVKSDYSIFTASEKAWLRRLSPYNASHGVGSWSCLQLAGDDLSLVSNLQRVVSMRVFQWQVAICKSCEFLSNW